MMIPITDQLWAAIRLFLGQVPHKHDEVAPLIQGLEACKLQAQQASQGAPPDNVTPFDKAVRETDKNAISGNGSTAS